MRWPKTMTGPVCPRSPRFLPGVGACFFLMGTSERLPMWTTLDVWFGTLRKSSMKSVWHVDRVFPYWVYINSNHHDSQIWVSLVCGIHHIDNLMNLMSLLATDVVLLNTLNCLQLFYDWSRMHLSFERIWLELKLESKDSLLAWVWHSIELIPWSLAY
jgi:hypothetical protein